MTRRISGNAGGRATRERLLQTAERLFAQRGIEAVSLREILDAAGQRNKSAAQYHFGGKEGLVSALANYRTGPLNARRMARLDEVVATGLQDDTRSVVEALVYPLAEILDEPDNHFLGFLARYHLDRPFRTLQEFVDPSLTESYRRTATLLAASSGMAPSSFEIRFSLALDMCFTALALRQAAEEDEGTQIASREQFVVELVEAVHGIFVCGPQGSLD